jgi:dipeptidyl aminopeptidase/acylaminoacyl peptidase
VFINPFGGFAALTRSVRVLLAALALLGAGAAQASDSVSATSLATLRDLDGLSLSPDGRWAAFQVRRADPQSNRYEIAWYVSATVLPARARRVADGGEPILSMSLGRLSGGIEVPSPVWLPDSREFVFLRKTARSVQAWRARRDGTLVEQLTHVDGDVRALAVSRDGQRILFQTEPSAAQVQAMLAAEARKGFLYDRRFSPVYSTSPTLPVDAALKGDWSSTAEVSARRIWTHELKSQRERAATSAEQAEFASILIGPRPANAASALRYAVATLPNGAMAWTDARDPKLQGPFAPLTLVAQGRVGETPIVCSADECTSQWFRGVWWRDEQEIVFARAEGPRFADTTLYAWRPGQSRVRRILLTPGKLASPDAASRVVSQKRLIALYEEAGVPTRLISIDLDSGAMETLFDPNPDFARLELGAWVQRLTFHSPAGAETFGYLVLPPDRRRETRLPLVVVTYRCSGFLRGGTGDEYPVYPLASEGFAVLCFAVPDLDFEQLAKEDWNLYQTESRGPGDPEKRRVQEALDAAVSQLDAMGVIDSGRIGLTGLSFGGETVSYALFNMPRLTTAIASGTDIAPAVTFLGGPAATEVLKPWGLDSPASDRWNTLALSRNARHVRAPLLLNIPDHELIGSLEPFAALEEAGRAVEMYVFPDEYHVKWQPAHRLAVYERNIDWMNFWLRGVEDRASGKAAQYQRWRSLRARQCATLHNAEEPQYCRH